VREGDLFEKNKVIALFLFYSLTGKICKRSEVMSYLSVQDVKIIEQLAAKDQQAHQLANWYTKKMNMAGFIKNNNSK